MPLKTRVGVFFGGKSVEHEISIISAMQAIAALDCEKYDIVPIYITKSGEMYTGDAGTAGNIASYKNIPELLKKLVRVILVNDGGEVKMIKHPAPRFSKSEVGALDVALPVVHGTNVEDGNLQGWLHSVGLPFCGCNTLSSALGMDKFAAKAVMKFHGLPVVDGICRTALDYASDKDKVVADIESTASYPVIVKPVNLGSSIGIGKAKDREALVRCLDEAFNYSDRVLVERAVQNLREINCSVLGDIDGAKASVCEEPLNATDILSYGDKYMSGGSKDLKVGVKGGSSSAGMADLKRKCPADIPDETSDKIRSLAVETFKALGCSGVSRIDFLMDSESGEVFVNEINTIPGSLSFYLWEATGMSFTALLDEVISLAFKRARRDKSLTYSFDTNVLAGATLSSGKK